MFPEIHLWCDTSASVYSQHSSWSLSPHVCFSRGRMLDLNHRPPAWQVDVLTTRPQRPGYHGSCLGDISSGQNLIADPFNTFCSNRISQETLDSETKRMYPVKTEKCNFPTVSTVEINVLFLSFLCRNCVTHHAFHAVGDFGRTRVALLYKAWNRGIHRQTSPKYRYH